MPVVDTPPMQDIVDIKPLVLLGAQPSSLWWLWITLAIGACVLLGGLWWLRKRRKSKAPSPQQILENQLHEMQAPDLSLENVYTMMASVVRQTIAVAWDRDGTGLTAKEMAQEIVERTHDASLGHDISEILLRGEHIRFSSGSVHADNVDTDRQRIREFALQVGLQGHSVRGGKS